MSEFKVGDVVRCIFMGAPRNQNLIGKTFIVEEIPGEFQDLKVRQLSDGKVHSFNKTRFEKI